MLSCSRSNRSPASRSTVLRKARGWPDFSEALSQAHAPAREEDLDPTTPARQRLAYDELLASQLALMVVRAKLRAVPGRALNGDGRLRAKALAALPFVLTEAQNLVLREITADMASNRRMLPPK